MIGKSGLSYKPTEGLDQEFLEQVFRFSFATGQAKREAVQTIEVRLHQGFKSVFVGCAAHTPFVISLKADLEQKVVVDQKRCEQEAKIADRIPEHLHR